MAKESNKVSGVNELSGNVKVKTKAEIAAEKENETIETGGQSFSSIMNSIPSIDNSSDFLHDMYALRDRFFESFFIFKFACFIMSVVYMRLPVWITGSSEH